MENKLKNVVIDGATLYYTNEDITDPETSLETLKASYFATAKAGVSILAKPIIREMEYAGKLGRKNVGDERVQGWEVTSECEVLDFHEAVLTASLFEKATTTGTKLDKFVPKATIGTSEYKNLVVVGRVKATNNPAIAIIKNTFNVEGTQFTMEDNNEAGNKMKFDGHYDGEEIPFELYLPKLA